MDQSTIAIAPAAKDTVTIRLVWSSDKDVLKASENAATMVGRKKDSARKE
ncbi:hypothetical protein [Saccharopolyspora karakumensis]|nr:hypothetical protein [Saccharopolyspora karakumensis]